MKNSKSIAMAVLNIVAAVATLCTTTMLILNAIKNFKDYNN